MIKHRYNLSLARQFHLVPCCEILHTHTHTFIVGESLFAGLRSRSSASVRLHGSPEPALAGSEGMISIQYHKDFFVYKRNGPGSISFGFVFLLYDVSSHAARFKSKLTKVLTPTMFHANSALQKNRIVVQVQGMKWVKLLDDSKSLKL